MSKIHRELEELRDVCAKLESQFSTKVSEVEHLKRAYEQAQEECKHMKEMVSFFLSRSFFCLMSYSEIVIELLSIQKKPP